MKLPDGRSLSWAEYGPASSPIAVVHHHGTGSSRLELAWHEHAIARLGVRVLAPDRPGFGGSSAFDRGRTVADWTADVDALVEHLGISSFAVAGYSGGGPHALAVAAGLGERVTRVILQASVAPEQPPRNGFDREIREQAGVRSWQEFVAWYDPSAAEGAMVLAPADDAAFADSSFAEAGLAAVTEGTRQGWAGEASDMWALATPWGFDLDSVTQPVDIRHGDADTRVPVSHAYALERLLPDAALRVRAGDGHFSITKYLPDELAVLRSG